MPVLLEMACSVSSLWIIPGLCIISGLGMLEGGGKPQASFAQGLCLSKRLHAIPPGEQRGPLLQGGEGKGCRPLPEMPQTQKSFAKQ